MNDQNPDDRMSLGEHLDELRGCLLRVLVGVIVGLVVCLLLGERIMQVMCWPAAAAMNYLDRPIHLRTIAPAEGFVTYVKVCLIWGLIVSAPFGLWQLWRFVAVGLLDREKRVVRRYVPLSVILFFLGVAFFFVVIAPICLVFFMNFEGNYPRPTWLSPVLPDSPAENQPDDAIGQTGPFRLPVLPADPRDPAEGDIWKRADDNTIRYFSGGKVRALAPSPPSFLSTEMTVSLYMSFVSWLSLVFGLGFQVPIVVLVLAGTGIVPLARLKKMRRYVVLVLLVLAAVMTPPDVISQVSLALPMYLLYELGLLLAGRPAKTPSSQA